MTWLRHLVAEARKGNFPVETLSAHVASFCGKHPVDGGLALEPIVSAALKGKGGCADEAHHYVGCGGVGDGGDDVGHGHAGLRRPSLS